MRNSIVFESGAALADDSSARLSPKQPFRLAEHQREIDARLKIHGNKTANNAGYQQEG